MKFVCDGCQTRYSIADEEGQTADFFASAARPAGHVHHGVSPAKVTSPASRTRPRGWRLALGPVPGRLCIGGTLSYALHRDFHVLPSWFRARVECSWPSTVESRARSAATDAVEGHSCRSSQNSRPCLEGRHGWLETAQRMLRLSPRKSVTEAIARRTTGEWADPSAARRSSPALAPAHGPADSGVAGIWSWLKAESLPDWSFWLRTEKFATGWFGSQISTVGSRLRPQGGAAADSRSGPRRAPRPIPGSGPKRCRRPIPGFRVQRPDRQALSLAPSLRRPEALRRRCPCTRGQLCRA